MEKRISVSQFNQVRTAARMLDPDLRKLESLKKKIMPLAAEMKACQTKIDALEAGIVSVIGFHVSDLVKKVIEPTGKTDKNGKPLMKTTYVPTDIVHKDEATNQFVITATDEPTSSEEPIVPPTTEGRPGSDFDADAQNAALENAENNEEDNDEESFL